VTSDFHAGIEQVEVGRAELLEALRFDCVTFFSFYLADELTLAVPDLHCEVWDELLTYVEKINRRQVNLVLKKLFAIPRGFAKSTIAKLATILFLKYTPYKFVLYVSKTNAHAKNAIRDIITWLQGENEGRLFGLAIQEKSSETESLWIFKIAQRATVTGGVTWKRVIFKALGADQQVRGLNILNMRPQIVVVDDIEDNDNTTPELQPKLDTWFMGALIKALATEAFILFIGNMIRETTLLARLSKDPEWNPTVYGAIVRKATGIVSLWEEKFPLVNLLAEYKSYRRLGVGHVWETEMMNLTQESILAKDLTGVIRMPIPDPEDLMAGCLILDPAFGKDAQHDYSAITVHVRIQGLDIPCLVDSWEGKESEEGILNRMIELSYYWGITTWFIESAAAQKLLISLFTLLLRERRIPDGIFMILPITSGGVAKASRIHAFTSVVKSGSYGIAESQQDLIDRLAAYDPNSAKHDDLEDSAAYGAIVWQHYNTVIDSQGVKQVAMLIKQGVLLYKAQYESEISAF